MRLDRAGTRLAAGTVAAVAGYSSWRHIVEVASGAGEDASVAMVLPLSVDGLVVVASLAMLEDKRADKLPRLSARVALGFGVLATLAFNLASAEATVTARAVAAVPAVAFLLAVEVLSRAGKPRPVPDVVPAQPAPVERPVVPATDRPAGLGRDLPPATDVAASPSVVTESPKVKPARKPSRKESRRQSREDTARRVLAAVGELPPDATKEEIAAKARTSARTVGRCLDEARAAGILPVPAQPAPDGEHVVLPFRTPAELEPMPDPAHGGELVPVGAAT